MLFVLGILAGVWIGYWHRELLDWEMRQPQARAPQPGSRPALRLVRR